jgi:hypothetical protein
MGSGPTLEGEPQQQESFFLFLFTLLFPLSRHIVVVATFARGDTRQD